MMRKEVIVACFNVPFQNMPEGTELKQKRFRCIWSPDVRHWLKRLQILDCIGKVDCVFVRLYKWFPRLILWLWTFVMQFPRKIVFGTENGGIFSPIRVYRRKRLLLSVFSSVLLLHFIIRRHFLVLLCWVCYSVGTKLKHTAYSNPVIACSSGIYT
jgi:hypothetical protein